MEDNDMSVSVVIPTYNSADTLEECLKSIFNQDTSARFDVIVVDDASTDETNEVCEPYMKEKGLKYIRIDENKGQSHCRNTGARQAKGEIIAFTDSDCRLESNWITLIINAFKDMDVIGVTGRVIYDADIADISIRDRIVRQNNADYKWIYITSNIAYRRIVFEKTSGFDENVRLGEDFQFAYDVLSKDMGDIVYHDELVVHHQRQIHNIFSRRLFWDANYVKWYVDFHVRTGKMSEFFFWKIFLPKDLIIVLCPPVLLITRRIKGIKDLLFVPILWLSKVIERLLIWKTAIKHKRLII